MTDNEIFEEVKQRMTDPKVMDLLRAGLADPKEMEDVKRAIRYGQDSMKIPSLRDKLYKLFDRLLNVVKDDSTTRQMVKQDLRKMQKGDSAMSEDLMSTIIKTLHLNEEEILTSGGYSGKYANLNDAEPRVETVPNAKKARDALHARVKAATAKQAKERGMTDSQHNAIVHHAIIQGRDNGYPIHKLHHKAPADSPASSTTHASVEDYVKAHGSTVTGHAEHIIKNFDHYKKHFQKGQLHAYGEKHHTSEGTDMNKDLNTANVAKAVMHDCVTHVVDEEWGVGQCIPTMHDLSEDGIVTKYDIMFAHGIEKNVFIDEKKTKSTRHRMHEHTMMEAEEMAPVTPAGGEDSSKASKKGKPEMPMEKLKAIMEKRKSEAYKAMPRSQGKMEEEVVAEGKITHIVAKDKLQAHKDEMESEGYDTHTRPLPANHPKAKTHIGIVSKSPVESSYHETMGHAEEIHEKKLTSAEMKKREEVAKAHTVPKTDKEKSLAALAAPHDKITHADVMVGRGVGKKKTMKEFVEQLAESLSSKAE